MYADDTCLFKQDKKLIDLNRKINNQLKNINNWMLTNKSVINPSKTTSLLIHHSLRAKPLDIQIELNSTFINNSTSVTYLGVLLDNCLNFKHHIKKLENKTAKGTGLLWKLSKFLPLKVIYFAVVYPHLIYGILA